MNRANIATVEMFPRLRKLKVCVVVIIALFMMAMVLQEFRPDDPPGDDRTGHLSESASSKGEGVNKQSNVSVEARLVGEMNRIKSLLWKPKAPNPHLASQHEYHSGGLFSAVERHFNTMHGFFFVDLGADSDVEYSISLWLETERGWDGLVVEPDAQKYASLQEKRRRVPILNACIRTGPDTVWPSGGTYGTANSSVPCFWVSDILSAVFRRTIHVLNIDVEGHEIAILGAIPFDLLNIKVITVEYHGIDPEKIEGDVRNFLTARGYGSVKLLVDHTHHISHIIYSRG